MTIAIAIKVHDGIVLASDSASTLFRSAGAGPATVANVYNNANKIFNICKGLPIGGMTWGAGSIGTASISTLVKDLRRRLCGEDGSATAIDRKNYQLEDIATLVRKFLFEENYEKVYGALPENQRPQMGFLVAGYSTGKPLAEEWLIDIEAGGKCPPPKRLRNDDDAGAYMAGEPEIVQRILVGFGTKLPRALEKLGIDPNLIPGALQVIQRELAEDLIVPPMPIQDVIDLAEFLVSAAVMFSRFKMGAATVGGPIESAAITKHEGFKWVKRKYYFDSRLNPVDVPRPES